MKHAIPKIEAGKVIDAVREVIRRERYADEDKRKSLKESVEPITDKLKEEIKVLKMLTGPDPDSAPAQVAIEGPISKELKGSVEKLKSIRLDPNKGFSTEELELLEERKLSTPLGVLRSRDERSLGEVFTDIKGRRNEIHKEKKRKGTTKAQEEAHDKELGVLTKFKKRISEIDTGLALVKGSGLGRSLPTGRPSATPSSRSPLTKGAYNQPKRNAYKIGKNGEYGRLMIDHPRLLSHLQLTATKDGKKVFERSVEFDTLDLLTKRFNSKKKYYPLSRLVFDELNTLGELPIHRTSKKYSKIGSGVLHFSNQGDLSDRLMLLGGSIKSGNDSARNEFTAVAHALHELGEITRDQLKAIRISSINREKSGQSTPDDFVIKFTPPLRLPEDMDHRIGLSQLSMTYSWHNITRNYDNDLIKYTSDGGSTWKDIRFIPGSYSYDDLNKYIENTIGQGNTDGISISFVRSTYKVKIKLASGFQLDLRNSKFGDLIGFDEKIVTATEVGPRLPNITNSIDVIYINCSIIDDS